MATLLQHEEQTYGSEEESETLDCGLRLSLSRYDSFDYHDLDESFIIVNGKYSDNHTIAEVVSDIPEPGIHLGRKKLRKKSKAGRIKQKQKQKQNPEVKKKKNAAKYLRRRLKRMTKSAGDKITQMIEVSVDPQEVLYSDSELEEPQYVSVRNKILSTIPKELNTPIQQVNKTDRQIEDLLYAELKNYQHTTSFYITDLSTLVFKHLQWKRVLPRVEAFYAVKCNPDPVVVKTLSICGTGLDCASETELKLGLASGVPADKIIFANPIKTVQSLNFAKQHGVKMMTFDNAAELEKIHKVYPEAQVVLRILGDDSHSLLAFGSKFGAKVDTEVPQLIALAAKLRSHLIGVSFHVGSGCMSIDGFINSITMAADVFKQARDYGIEMTLLDIGGGWPGVDTEKLNFKNIASPLNAVIDELFPAAVRVIAEPGRYFATECVTLASNIVSRRDRQVDVQDPHTGLKTSKNVVQYYLSDGVYGSFNNIIFDHAQVQPRVLGKSDPQTAAQSSQTSPQQQNSSTLFGPTCDSMDIICPDVELPDLEEGDWLYFTGMGAYTSAAATSFNGFHPPKSTYIIS